MDWLTAPFGVMTFNIPLEPLPELPVAPLDVITPDIFTASPDEIKVITPPEPPTPEVALPPDALIFPTINLPAAPTP